MSLQVFLIINGNSLDFVRCGFEVLMDQVLIYKHAQTELFCRASTSLFLMRIIYFVLMFDWDDNPLSCFVFIFCTLSIFNLIILLLHPGKYKHA